jgi:hypothetical protein
MISDGKPNDVDQYDGRYGVEDLRQAVIEARLQGISPFCLTIDHVMAYSAEICAFMSSKKRNTSDEGRFRTQLAQGRSTS